MGMTLPANHKEEIPDQVVAALRTALGDRLVAVVLFGSRARGEAREDSDWDVLVIAGVLPESHWERYRLIRQALLGVRGGTVSVVAKTLEEFESHVVPLYLDIALDGQACFDPTGYAEKKLSQLRWIIERKGLYRERTAAGDLWRWKTPPVRPWTVEWEPDDAAA